MREDATAVRTAVVTGAASGVGAATVAALARDGYRVASLDLDQARAQRVVDGIGDGHLALGLDVADESAVIAAFEEIARRMGRIDALATCAGIADTTPFLETTAEAFRRLYDVNVIGTFLCMREAARHMRPGSRICTVASVSGIRGGGLTGTVAYASSKGGVLALTKNAARALVDKGIAVNAVAPGPVLTPMLAGPFADVEHRRRVESLIPLGRSADASEIAESIVWLLSPRASYVHGETLVVDGGLVMQ
ncbi:MAG TPA: SDR family oxidoreductase [Candidatus Dormibacteraeota bacterium]|nr:SDR family oxidoreductase [Candidatus Dormibacteraeota bacterium]